MKIKIKIILFLLANILISFTLKSQNVQNCDSILRKEPIENSYSYHETTFEDFDYDGNLKIFGGLNKKKKTGQWYFFTNNICDSICEYKNNIRTGKSYYFKDGDIDLITYKSNSGKFDTCYNSNISKEHYLTESFRMDACIQSAPFYYCNGIHKDYFPFSLATKKIEDLCLKIAGISKAIYTITKQ